MNIPFIMATIGLIIATLSFVYVMRKSLPPKGI